MEVFDIETLTIGHKTLPYAIGYSHGGSIVYQKVNLSVDFLTQIILENFESKQYYAHNLLFDFLQFLPGLLKFNIKFTWIFLEYKLYGVKIYYRNKIIHLKCSYKLIPYGIGNFYPTLVDVPKLPFPYHVLEKWNPQESCAKYTEIPHKYKELTLEAYFEIYTKQDVMILKKGLAGIFNTFKALNIQVSKNAYTCGGIALKYYTQKWNQINLHLATSHKNLIRNAYCGGRVEVFGNLKSHEKILHFDFPGMYQQCMLEKLPHDTFEFTTTNSIIGPGFYFIKTKFKNELPVLPLKEGKLFFKEGCIEGWFWYEEIELFQQVSEISYLEIVHGLVAKQYSTILLEFVNNLNEIKKAGGIKKEIGKLLINSFYGRLGMDDDLYAMSLTRNATGLKTYGIIKDFFLLKKKIKKHPQANVAIAAAITAKARIKLYKGFLEVVKNSGRILYCDTDSIFAAFAKNKNIENTQLGDVIFNTALPHTCIKDAIFIKPKTYGLAFENNEIVKIKGVNTRFVSFETLKKKFYNKECLTISNTHFFKKNLEIDVLQLNKKIQLHDYTKRLWNNDFTSTQPIFNAPKL